jgi:hypothetical protein
MYLTIVASFPNRRGHCQASQDRLRWYVLRSTVCLRNRQCEVRLSLQLQYVKRRREIQGSCYRVDYTTDEQQLIARAHCVLPGTVVVGVFFETFPGT